MEIVPGVSDFGGYKHFKTGFLCAILKASTHFSTSCLSSIGKLFSVTPSSSKCARYRAASSGAISLRSIMALTNGLLSRSISKLSTELPSNKGSETKKGGLLPYKFSLICGSTPLQHLCGQTSYRPELCSTTQLKHLKPQTSNERTGC